MKAKCKKYVIYDQFHWLKPDHLVRHVEGKWEDIVAQYRFYKDAFPGESLGLCTDEWYKRILDGMKRKCNICNK